MLAKTFYLSVMLCIAQGKLLEVPENTEAVVGQQVVLKCRTDIDDITNPVEWRYKENKKTTAFQHAYYRGHILKPYNGRLRVVPNRTTGHYDLIIEHVQLDDAGTYTCTDRDLQHPAELIVFDKYPSNEFCTVTSPSDGNHNNCGLESVAMSCDMRYRGNLGPVLEWRDGENTIPSTTTNKTDRVIKSSIQLIRYQVETSKYTCRVRYPSFTSRFAWSTMNTTPTATTTNVLFGGCDLNTIDCSDENSPQCRYTWLTENGTELAYSFSMDLTGKPNGTYTCSANCSLHETPCSYVAKKLNYMCNDHSKQGTSLPLSPETMAMAPGTVAMAPGTMIMVSEALKSSPGITSPEIYIPISILVIGILIVIIILLLFRRSFRVCSDRRSTREDAAENGQINNTIEMESPNGTTPQGTTMSLTRNTEIKQVNLLNNGAPNNHEMPEKITLLVQS